MNKLKFKKIIAFLLLCVILFLIPLTVFAASPEVSFDGENITFTPLDNGLFASFKDLMPGDKREQNIKLINNSNKKAAFNLRMKAAPQQNTSAEDVKLIEELVFNSELLKITITANGTVVYSGSVGGGKQQNFAADDAESSTVIRLGTLSPKHYTNLNVNLEVSKNVDDRYQKAIAFIDWEFVAEENGGFDETASGGNTALPERPNTGSDSILEAVAVTGTAFIAMISTVLAERKTKKGNK